MHVYICVCDEIWNYYEENFFESISAGLVFPGMLVVNCSFILLHICHVYGCQNKWIVHMLAASLMKYLLKLKMLQYFGLSNEGFAVVR